MKKGISIILSVILLFCYCQPVIAADDDNSAHQIVDEITFGWNLGNTLDASNASMKGNISISKELYYETLWGNPYTTKQMIDTVKAAGCNAIRIPVTYYNHLDEQGRIDSAWLQRIGEVVQYCLEDNLYVIINIHHDTGNGKNKIIQANLENIEQNKLFALALWWQIAEYFKNYDNRLLFESFNETLDMAAENPWYGNQSSWQAMNILNQTFVDTVRMTGGNNATRNLIVNTYGAQTTYGPMNSFVLPRDTVQDHLIVEIHYFGSSESGIKGAMGSANKYLVQKGYPVIVGEFGTTRKSDIAYRVNSVYTYMNYAKSYGIKCFWWDDGGDYRLLNRKNCTWYYPQIIEAMRNSN